MNIAEHFEFPQQLLTLIKEIDDTVGVYQFLNAEGYPLYIGKSKTIRTRLLSHFREFAHSNRKQRLLLQTKKITCIYTAGEYSALFKEAEMVKNFMPLYNKQLRRCRGYVTIHINAKEEVEFSRHIAFNNLENHYGLFKNIASAKEKVEALAESSAVCKKACGLSHSAPCFKKQLGKCQQACHDKDFHAQHLLALRTHLQDIQLKQWPYQGAIAIKEKHPQGVLEQYLVLYQWCFLGITHTLEEIPALIKGLANKKFDKDYYYLALKLLNSVPASNLIQLPVR